ncbi:hypothetical protein [Streptomyces yunnanensis]|uniref:hypothetical protein n=1 Tax=Streptomyces yunnanensis TaxID=156453 RepID=UPI00142D607E|nr:hypothetical protein [Streptomyces yunnanensis]
MFDELVRDIDPSLNRPIPHLHGRRRLSQQVQQPVLRKDQIRMLILCERFSSSVFVGQEGVDGGDNGADAVG